MQPAEEASARSIARCVAPGEVTPMAQATDAPRAAPPRAIPPWPAWATAAIDELQRDEAALRAQADRTHALEARLLAAFTEQLFGLFLDACGVPWDPQRFPIRAYDPLDARTPADFYLDVDGIRFHLERALSGWESSQLLQPTAWRLWVEAPLPTGQPWRSVRPVACTPTGWTDPRTVLTPRQQLAWVLRDYARACAAAARTAAVEAGDGR